MKPDRSDEALSDAQLEKNAKQVREQFEALAPKRPFKPARSEPQGSSGAQHPSSHGDFLSPESLKFRDLEARSEPLVTEGGVAADDLYLENGYYKDLIAAESGEHHTTGTGFIKVDCGKTNGHFHLVDEHEASHTVRTRCNPATNDWIPSPAAVSSLSAAKPRRSDP